MSRTKTKIKILFSTMALMALGSLAPADASATGFWPLVDESSTAPQPSFSWEHPFSLFGDESVMDSVDAWLNEDSSSISYNITSDDQSLWNHDGKGNIFADDEKRINDDPQLRTAKPGDVLNFSTKIKTERYYGSGTSNPVTTYALYGFLSGDLTFDRSSVVVKVNDEVLSSSAYTLQALSIPSSQQAEFAGAKYGAFVSVTWSNNGTFIYPEGATIEFLYSATVKADSTLDHVYSNGLYYIEYKNGSSTSYVDPDMDDLASGKRKAIALLKGNLAIRRVDESGNPLAGAKYTVEGVTATKQGEGVYKYDESGDVSEFVTNSDGVAVISGLSIDSYTATEVAPPEGQETKQKTITKDLATDNAISVTAGEKFYMDRTALGASTMADISETISTTSDGTLLVDATQLYVILGASAEGLTTTMTMNYDENTGGTKTYSAVSHSVLPDGNGGYIYSTTRSGRTYTAPFEYDEVLGKYRAPFTLEADADASSNISDGWYLAENGNSATVAINGSTANLTASSDSGCYTGTLSNGRNATACKEGDRYYIEIENWYCVFFDYDDSLGKYTIDLTNVMGYILTDGPQSGQITISVASVLPYSESFDHYYTPVEANLSFYVVRQPNTILATEYLFGSPAKTEPGDGTEPADDTEKEDATPESVPANPQTSDQIGLIALVAVTSISIYHFAIKRSILR